VLELGAGAALPSLLASIMPQPPSRVVISDYPDEIILGNLRKNVERNTVHRSPGCEVSCVGYEWGTDVKPLLALVPELDDQTKRHNRKLGFDALILSDLLHFRSSHSDLIYSMTHCLMRARTSRVYVSAGTYTSAEICSNFLLESEQAGLQWEEGERSDVWTGMMKVSDLTLQDLGTRKGMCRWWVGRWKEEVIPLQSDY